MNSTLVVLTSFSSVHSYGCICLPNCLEIPCFHSWFSSFLSICELLDFLLSCILVYYSPELEIVICKQRILMQGGKKELDVFKDLEPV